MESSNLLSRLLVARVTRNIKGSKGSLGRKSLDIKCTKEPRFVSEIIGLIAAAAAAAAA